MTGELSPRRQPKDSGAELRASHEDRDRVVDALRIAAGDGRLSSDELDERLEAALTARTYRELAVLTADLPAAPAASPAAAVRPAPKDLIRMSHRGGNGRQVGQWVVPRRMEIEVIGGNVLLDFRQAILTGPTLQIEVANRGGNFTIITRPGMTVDASEVTTVGGNVAIKAPGNPAQPVVLAVDVSGEVRGGNIRVRGPRRSFWDWLRRRPADG